MEYKPFNAKQKELIEVCLSIISSWPNSNDITSPSMGIYIETELQSWDLDSNIQETIEMLLWNLLKTIIRYDKIQQSV